MTGSRRVIEIMNRFGHSISYHVMESMKTELATFITEKNIQQLMVLFSRQASADR